MCAPPRCTRKLFPGFGILPGRADTFFAGGFSYEDHSPYCSSPDRCRCRFAGAFQLQCFRQCHSGQQFFQLAPADTGHQFFRRSFFCCILGGHGCFLAASLAALPAYDADPLTGEAKRSNGRIVGVMVNNISNTSRQNARPQRGLSSADLLIECKVEGGITRFCAVFHDADSIPEIGPLRSGRDQFLQLLMPYQALYYHDGESAACTKFIGVYNYSGLNIGGKSYFNTPTHPHVAHRDSRGRDVAYEHTEFTSGKEIRQAASNAGIGLKYDYDATFFRFADYRTGEENAMQGASSGRAVSITHSDHYKTSFRYDPQSRTYKMQMYSRISGKFENTVDELNAKQLSFDNLLVCFAPIERYSGDSGDVQQVSYISGGDAYYFSRGAVQHVRWEKASPEHPLLVYDKTGAQMLFNRGKTYLAIVDDDEWSNFSYQ